MTSIHMGSPQTPRQRSPLKLPKPNSHLPAQERLFFGLRNRSFAAVKSAIRAGADVEKLNEHGFNALHFLVFQSAATRSLVFEQAPNLEILDPRGWTPLIIAAMCEDHCAIDLIEAGANFHARAHDGRSVLEIAKDYGCNSLVRHIEARVAEELRLKLEHDTPMASSSSVRDMRPARL